MLEFQGVARLLQKQTMIQLDFFVSEIQRHKRGRRRIVPGTLTKTISPLLILAQQWIPIIQCLSVGTIVCQSEIFKN